MSRELEQEKQSRSKLQQRIQQVYVYMYEYFCTLRRPRADTRDTRAQKNTQYTHKTHTHNAQVMSQSMEQQQKLQAAELRVAEMQEESDMRARRSTHIPTHTQYILSRAHSLAISLSLACARALAVSRSLALALSLSDVLVARNHILSTYTYTPWGPGVIPPLSYHVYRLFMWCSRRDESMRMDEHTHTRCANVHTQTC